MKTRFSQAVFFSFAGAALLAGAALSTDARASAIEQFKTFVTNTKTAKGEFVQQQMKQVNGLSTVTYSTTWRVG